MKRLLILLSLFCSLAILSGCSKPMEPVQTATTFFEQIGKNKAKEAYDSTAFAFQANLSLKSFESMMKTIGLTDNMPICTWNKPVTKDGDVSLEGNVTCAVGPRIPVSMTLTREHGRWCILKLHTGAQPGKFTKDTGNRFTVIGKGVAFNDAANQPLPSEKVLRQIVEDDLVLFNDALQRHSFAIFYNSVSYSWQQQLTLKQLQHAFQPFIDKKINLGQLRSLTATFDVPPAIDPDGLLVLVGHYPPQPSLTGTTEANPTGMFRVYFTLRYTYELPKWKLLGIDVQLTR